jgi:HTH-type transcriptional regulator, competence development regulator
LPTELGELLSKARDKKRLSLRDVERETGIHNAHLSQIEKGTIERPDPNILWSLSVLYELDFRRLLRLGGHVDKDTGGRKRSLLGTALHALGDLSPGEQQEVLSYMSQLKRNRIPGE